MENEEVVPEEVVVRRKPGRKPGQKYSAPQGMNVTPDALKDMMTALIAESKKPTLLEQRKIDEEEAQRVKLNKMRVEAARQEMAIKEARKAGCPHKDPRGKHTFRAQVNSDNCIRGICQICHTEFGPIRASQHQIANGVGLENYKDLTLEKLNQWAVQSMGA